MVNFMRGTLGRAKETLLVFIIILMATFMMGNGKMTREMARVESSLPMVANLVGTFLKIKPMETLSLRTKTETYFSLKPLIQKFQTN